MQNIGNYASAVGRGIIYVGRGLMESLPYASSACKIISHLGIGAQEELEEISNLEKKIEEYKN